MEYKVAQTLKQVEVHSAMLQQQASLGIVPGGQPGAESSQALVPINNGAPGNGNNMSVEQATQVAFLRDQLQLEAQKREQI